MNTVIARRPIGTLAEAVDAANRARTVPAYAREWNVDEVTAENWHTLPFLSKEKLIESALDARPFGDRLGVDRTDVAWTFVAPGPIYMPYTVPDMDEIADRFASTFASCGMTSDDVVDQTTMYNWVIAATALGRGLERLGCTVVPGGPGETVRHLDVLEDMDVTSMLAFPTFLVHLLDTAAEQGRKLSLQRAVVMGELHDPREKKRIADEYGIVVREYYGTADVGPVAAECVVGDGMHLRHGVYVEFADPETGELVEQPGRGRVVEIVVTDIVRTAMPIIRLRTGDLIDELVTEPCVCGDRAPRIRRIVGRAGDITKVKGMFIVPGSVRRVLQTFDVTANYQLVVTRDAGRDRLVLLMEGNEPPAWKEIHAEIEHALRVRCEVEFCAEVPQAPLLRDERRLV